MKTLGNAADRAEIGERMWRVRADSVRRWGKMSAPQMICHLADSFRGVMGEKALSPLPGTFGRGFLKWVALYSGLRWAHGVPTRPEMDQHIGGTRPGKFEEDLRELGKLLEKFTQQPRDFTWARHPFFPEMADEDWMRWGYLHMDHHFRQFGV